MWEGLLLLFCKFVFGFVFLKQKLKFIVLLQMAAVERPLFPQLGLPLSPYMSFLRYIMVIPHISLL